MARLHPFVTFLLLGFAASILGLLWDVVDGLILPPLPGIGFLSFLSGLACGGAILLWALASPKSWARWRVAVPTLLLGFLIVWFVPGPLLRLAISHFLQRRDLNEFAAQVHAYGRITVMWAPGESSEWLNGSRVARNRAELDSLRNEPYVEDAMLLADVFARDSIDPGFYEDFGRKLRRFHLRRLSLHGDYVLFARSRDDGFVYAGQGAPPLAPRGTVPGTGVVVWGRRGRWYRYYCCPHPYTSEPQDTGLVSQPTGGQE